METLLAVFAGGITVGLFLVIAMFQIFDWLAKLEGRTQQRDTNYLPQEPERWETSEHCICCERELDDQEICCNDGCCPYCGHLTLDEEGCTANCDTFLRTRRRVRTKNGWEWEYKADSRRFDQTKNNT